VTSDLGAPVLALGHLADGRLFVLAAQGRLRVWPQTPGQAPRDLNTGVRPRAWAWHAAGRLALVDDDPQLLHLLDLQEGRVRRAAAASALRDPALAFSPDGRTVWAASAGLARRYDFASGAAQATLAAPPDAAAVKALRVAADGRVALLDSSGRLSVQRPGAPRADDLGPLADGVAGMQWLADDPAGRLLVARGDGLLRAWPVDPGQAPLNLQERVASLVTSTDGRRALALSQPRGGGSLAALWDLPQAPLVAPAKLQFASTALWHPLVLLGLLGLVLWMADGVSEWRFRRQAQQEGGP
jgi:hypothetical protein